MEDKMDEMRIMLVDDEEGFLSRPGTCLKEKGSTLHGSERLRGLERLTRKSTW
jgi:hypothetical protein